MQVYFMAAVFTMLIVKASMSSSYCLYSFNLFEISWEVVVEYFDYKRLFGVPLFGSFSTPVKNQWYSEGYKLKIQRISLRPATLSKKRLWHRCFPVNFAKFLSQNTSGRLLLQSAMGLQSVTSLDYTLRRNYKVQWITKWYDTNVTFK